MKIGVAGVGRIGALHAASLKAGLGSANVVIADADHAHAARVGEKLRVSVLPDVDALLASGVDGLVVATPTDTHADLVLRGVEAGIPVFCEKPIAADLAGTRALVERVETLGGRVQVGFQRRSDNGYMAARAAVATGALGKIHTIVGHTLDPTPPTAAYLAVSGGIFRDCLIHDLDALRYVTGQEVVEVAASGSNLGADYIREAGDVDAVAVTLRMTDDSLAQLSASRYNRAGYDVRMEVRGHLDSVVVGWDERAPIRTLERVSPSWTRPLDPSYQGFLERFEGSYLVEMVAFAQLVAGDGPSRCTVADALAALVLAEACEISRRERRLVSVSEIAQ